MERTAKKAAKPAKTVKPVKAIEPAPQRNASKTDVKAASVNPRKVRLPTEKTEKIEKTDKSAKLKEKLVRDSFTMPQKDFGLIAVLKDRALGFKRPTKKSELLRAGLQVLAALPAPALRSALDALVPLKAGRPKRAD